MTDNFDNKEVIVNASAEMTQEQVSKLMEELAKNPAISDITITEGKDEVQPA